MVIVTRWVSCDFQLRSGETLPWKDSYVSMKEMISFARIHPLVVRHFMLTETATMSANGMSLWYLSDFYIRSPSIERSERHTRWWWPIKYYGVVESFLITHSSEENCVLSIINHNRCSYAAQKGCAQQADRQCITAETMFKEESNTSLGYSRPGF